MIYQAHFDNILSGVMSVDHIRNEYNDRVCAIRPDRKAGCVWIVFSDSRIGFTTELANVKIKAAARLIRTFLTGDRADAEYPDLLINQGVRDCAVMEATPTRCRVEYDMPNAGLVGGWRYYTNLGRFAYYSAY